MQKSIYKISLFAALIGLMVTGCSKELDIEPRQSVNSETAMDTYEGLEGAIVGAYDGIQDNASYGQDVIQLAEILADGAYWQGSYASYSEVADKAMNTNNTEASSLWIQSYDVINRTNLILDKIHSNTLSGGDYENNKDRIKGEALYIRAITYFELVRFFSAPLDMDEDGADVLGVPLMVKGVTSTESAQLLPVRASVKACYTQILEDLDQAQNLLPSYNEDRATSWAAKAMLSRVHMTLRNWELAAGFAREVVASGEFFLQPDVMTFLTTKNTGESIFEVQMRDSDNLGNNNQSLSDYWSKEERGEIVVPKAVVHSFASIDSRRQKWFEYELKSLSGGAVDTIYYSRKYKAPADNVPVIRLSEMMLNLAEAVLMEDNTINSEAVDMLNQIRERAGLADINVTSHEELLAAVKAERKRELIHEGHLINDYRRWQEMEIGYAREVLVGQSVAWNYDKLVFPIPQREKDVNPNLEQNTGY